LSYSCELQVKPNLMKTLTLGGNLCFQDFA
jgi:hypothetical protein